MDYLLLGRPLLGQQEYLPSRAEGGQDWGLRKMRVHPSIRYQTEKSRERRTASQVAKQVSSR